VNTRQLSDLEANNLKAGDNHYRSYVGPPDQYDLMGAMQFRLLCSLGLREWNKVLDFGCGSLRVGRILIPFLQSNCYFGIEPNEWLIEDAIERQLGQELIKLKHPNFSNNRNFIVPFDNCKFEFVLAQSIFSHTGVDAAEKILKEFSRVTTSRGIVAATFELSQDGSDFSGTGWIYPKCVRYDKSLIFDLAQQAGFVAIEIPFFHPRQRWFLMSRNQSVLPVQEQLALLAGAVFNVEEFSGSLTCGLSND